MLQIGWLKPTSLVILVVAFATNAFADSKADKAYKELKDAAIKFHSINYMCSGSIENVDLHKFVEFESFDVFFTHNPGLFQDEEYLLFLVQEKFRITKGVEQTTVRDGCKVALNRNALMYELRSIIYSEAKKPDWPIPPALYNELWK